jgi:hypothetical protein
MLKGESSRVIEVEILRDHQILKSPDFWGEFQTSLGQKVKGQNPHQAEG